jgi:hypothetical protein
MSKSVRRLSWYPLLGLLPHLALALVLALPRRGTIGLLSFGRLLLVTCS